MKKIVLSLMIFVFAAWNISAQDLNAPINNDPKVKIGKLSNGITYYIRENKKPEKRVEFRLVVNAGSMQENEDQLGMAHFVEHLGFNGIEGYPGNTMINELQKIGVSFGREINAYTSFDETVYLITMPTENPKNVEMGMNILKGWANGYLLDKKEIDNERGIIIEEYRMGLGADDRMRKKWFPVLFNGSRYAERLPIGTLDVLEKFQHQTLKDFYYDWYRPDLQAIIVVGDIKTAEIEKMIKDKFSNIPAKANPREKILYPIPEAKEPNAIVCTDPEASGNQLFLARIYEHDVMKTVGDFKEDMMVSLFNMMYSSRLTEMIQNPQTPFFYASVEYDHFIGNADTYMTHAAVKEGKTEEAIIALMKEDYRVLKYGFLESEFLRAKDELMNNFETAANEADKTESSVFTSQYTEHYLRATPIPGVKRELKFAEKYLPEITLEEVNALAAKWIKPNNIVAIALLQEKADIAIPTKEKIIAILNDKSLSDVEPYIDTYKNQELVEKDELKAGKITSVKELPAVKATEVTLSNGIKVILKKTDFKNDEILFSAKSRGGLSLYNENDLASGHFAADMIDRAGIAELNYSSLEKKMKGKKAGIVPYISVLEEGFSGSSTPKDLEFFFQYLHAFFTNPRYDTAVYELIINETLEQMKMMKAVPMYIFFGNLVGTLSQNDPYKSNVLTFTEEFVNQADYDRAFQIYKERFANPADFTFCFVGNFDENEMNNFLELYVGSLPTTNVKEDFRGEVLKEFPKGKIRDNVYAGIEEQSWVGIALSKEYPWNLQNNMIVNQIADALQIELIEVIREKMSGVYSPMLQMGGEKYPKSIYTTLVMFSCKPENTDKLANAVMKILATFQKKGPKKETLEKVKEQMIKKRQTDMEKNNFWLSYIQSRYFNGEALDDLLTYNERVKAITNKDIIDFMQKYFDLNSGIRVDMYPENRKK